VICKARAVGRVFIQVRFDTAHVGRHNPQRADDRPRWSRLAGGLRYGRRLPAAIGARASGRANAATKHRVGQRWRRHCTRIAHVNGLERCATLILKWPRGETGRGGMAAVFCYSRGRDFPRRPRSLIDALAANLGSAFDKPRQDRVGVDSTNAKDSAAVIDGAARSDPVSWGGATRTGEISR
jgi:hypothetical protein